MSDCINKLCIIQDEECNTDTITLSGCTLTQLAINEIDAGHPCSLGDASFVLQTFPSGNIGSITYNWSIGNTNIFILNLVSNDIIGLLFANYGARHTTGLYLFPLQAVTNITSRIVDSIGCVSTKTIQLLVRFNTSTGCYDIIINPANHAVVGTPTWVALFITSNSVQITATAGIDNLCCDLTLRLTNSTGTIVLLANGHFTSFNPYDITGLLANQLYYVEVKQYNPDGTITLSTGTFTTLP